MPTLNARSIKCVVPLDPAELAAMPSPEGVPRVVLRIKLPDRVVTADVSAKSVRKAIATVAENEPDQTVCFVQGKLVAGDQIAEAGLVAQVKAKPAAVAA